MDEQREAAAQYCLIGGSVSNSPSPAMMNAAFSVVGIDATYFSLSVQSKELAERFRELKLAGIRGMNVTIPFKNSIMALLDGLDQVSSRIGAVNVVENAGGDYIGHNTDVDGVLGPLQARFPGLRPRHALVLGAGGAARAFLEAMRRSGCEKVTVVVREKSRAASFLKEMTRACEGVHLELRSLHEGDSIGSDVDLVFNATPAGSPGQPFPSEVLPLLDSRTIVFDALYRPMETELIQRAKELGCRVLYGYEMLLGQGVAAFKLWTGKDAPAQAMKNALLRRLEVVGE